MKTNSWDQTKAILRSLGSTLNKRIAEVASVAQTALNKANSASATAQKKMDANNPAGTGSFSMGRKENSYIGDFSFAAGVWTTASGEAAHAEGYSTISSSMASHAEGFETNAQGIQAHAEGKYTTAKGGCSHAEGNDTEANGHQSHSEGMGTEANGECSHSEGCETKANGECSHAEGYYTTASGDRQHVQGRFNIEDTENRYAHIVGNGENALNRSNAHTLSWEGTAWYPSVKIGGTSEDDARDVGAAIDALETEIAELGGGTWERIEAITLDEDTNIIERTAHPNGTPYNLAAAKVKVQIFYPITKGVGTSVVFKSDNTTLGFLVTTIIPFDTGYSSHKSTAIFQAKPVSGTYEFIGADGSQGASMEMFYPSNGDCQFVPTDNKINRIKIEAWSDTFKAGTYIEIWGVRA